MTSKTASSCRLETTSSVGIYVPSILMLLLLLLLFKIIIKNVLIIVTMSQKCCNPAEEFNAVIVSIIKMAQI